MSFHSLRKMTDSFLVFNLACYTMQISVAEQLGPRTFFQLVLFVEQSFISQPLFLKLDRPLFLVP